MSDLIDRQAAIDAIEREQSLVERPITETRWFDLGLRKAQEVLSGLPTAQPELDEWCTANTALSVLPHVRTETGLDGGIKMDAVEYVKTKYKMCASFNRCHNCPLKGATRSLRRTRR